MLPLVRAVESLEVVDDWFHRRSARDAVAVLLQGCATHGASFWAWDAAAWTDVLGTSGNAFLTTYPRWARTSARSYAIALAYLFGFTELHFLGNVGRGAVARKVFGRAAVDQAVDQVTSVLHGWGQRSPQVTARTASLVCHALLLNRSPLLADLSEDALRGLRANLSIPYSLRQNVHSLHRALAALGHVRSATATGAIDPGARAGCGPGLGRLGAALARHLDPSRSRAGRAAATRCCGWGAGWPLSIPTSGSRASGPESCARPGSLPSTACASATTPKMTSPCATASASR